MTPEQKVPVRRVASRTEDERSLEAPAVEVSTTATANAKAADLDVNQSAIGNATVEGDANFNASVVGMVSSKGTSSLSQGFAGAVVSDGDAAIRQAGSGVIVGRNIGIEQGGSCVMVSGETAASRSYVGLLLSRNASFSEDSRVLFDWKAAIILAVVLLGIVGVFIVAAIVAAKLLMGRAHRVVERLPHIPTPHMPELPPWVSAVARRIRAA